MICQNCQNCQHFLLRGVWCKYILNRKHGISGNSGSKRGIEDTTLSKKDVVLSTEKESGEAKC